jgi:flagellar biosynthesis protein FlhF
MVAGVLGVAFRVIEEPQFLARALDGLRDRDLIFIDTPGFARDEADSLERLGLILANREEIDVHLVLPASMKPRDMERTINFYQPLNPHRLIFTRLDETDQIGTAIETAIQSGLPVSYLSGGPRVPEDLEAAQGMQLARRVFLPLAGGFARRAAA